MIWPEEQEKEEYINPEGTPREMPNLESEESAKQRRNQEKQGLKLLTPDQITNYFSSIKSRK